MLKLFFKKERQLESLIYNDVFIKKKEGVRALMSTIDQNESHCDHIERRIISKLFESDLEPFLKLQLKVHFYTWVGVPVSTSQAVIGAVLGIGLIKGIKTVSRRTLINTLMGWFLTPAIACSIAAALYFIFHLRYVPA